MIALKPSLDHQAIVVDIVEAAPHNVGTRGRFDWVGENLFAFAGLLSFQLEFEGYLFFTAKTELMDYYFGLGARLVRDRDFVFTTNPVLRLIKDFIGGGDIVEFK